MVKKATASSSVKAFPFGSAIQLARAVRTGAISSVDLLKAYLDRLDRLNPSLNAVVIDDRSQALKAARAADKALATGHAVGPLHGVPMTVKESFNLTGQQTTWGFPELKGNIAAEDAVAVTRLKAAGAVVFGKTNIPIALADFQSYNDVYGTTNNPWDQALGAGGSSGGSAAAVAAGLSALEFGSDIGGSIRNPAAYNGVYGHKPTWGLIPKRGQTTSADLLVDGDLSVIGPIARSADDLALALKVTVGPDSINAAGLRFRLPAPPASLHGLRVGVWLDEPSLSPVDASVRAQIELAANALRQAGAKVDFQARPPFDPATADRTYQRLLMALMSARRPDYADLAARVGSLDPHDDSAYATQLRYSTASFADFALANNEREHLRWAWHAFFLDHDVLLCPITATPPFPHDHSEPALARTMRVNGVDVAYYAQLFWAGLATCSYLPATVAPAGRTPAGLPVGVQIIGGAMRDRTTIWLAGQLAGLIGGFTPPPQFA